ncbi:MAG: hypothetical protein U5K69_25220 [Balneolaceae bacterium]|nr:hypothetical protein [Balneolaceae bacterium]
MPFREEDIQNVPISFLEPDKVMVRVGPFSAEFLQEPKIPLDGRHYKCAGKLILKNGQELRANFELQTHTFDFLEKDSVYVYVNGAWYSLDESELFEELGVLKEDALPFKWQPDRPLDYHESAPYPMNWYEE